MCRFHTVRQVTERVEQQVPVQVCKMVEEEVVRKVPVTTCRMVYEEKVEQTPVQVCKMVAYEETVQIPRVVEKRVPVTYTYRVPRRRRDAGANHSLLFGRADLLWRLRQWCELPRGPSGPEPCRHVAGQLRRIRRRARTAVMVKARPAVRPI